MDDRDSPYAHVDQPAFQQMQIDHNISRVAIFFVCFLTIGVFYFTLVNFPVAKLLPIQQVQQFTAVIGSLNPTASRTPVASNKPTGALGGSQISASPSASAGGSPAASPAASAVASAPSGAAPASSPPASVSARPSASAAITGSSYTVQSGDTLSSIARKSNTTVQALADANKMDANGRLRVGEQLVIPKR